MFKFEPEGRGEAEVLNHRRSSIADISISVAVIMLLVMTLYGFCAAGFVSPHRAEASVFGAMGTVAVAPDSVPHSASDEGVPSSINRFGSTNTTNVYIPTRSAQRTSCAALLSEADGAGFALSSERGQHTTDTPEFTPFLYIKTTHKRE